MAHDNSQHTPLPWRKDVHGHIGGAGGTNIASTWTTPDENYPEGRPYQANAEFIVRACNSHYELLEALKSCVNNDGGECLGDHPALLSAARAAIAKAEGK